MRVSVLTVNCQQDGYPDENFNACAAQVSLLAGTGVDLIVFPEFILGSPNQDDEALYTDHDGKYLKAFQQLASKHSVNIVPGTLATREAADSLLHNTAYWIDRHGKILGSYHKKNIWHSERPKFKKGKDEHSVFTTEFGTTSLLICWDVMFPEAFKELSRQGVELIVIPSYWLGTDGVEDAVKVHNPDAERLFLQNALVTRAFETNACIVYVNVVGPQQDGFIDCSQVTLPLKGAIGPPESSNNDTSRDPLVVDVGSDWLDVLADAEKMYKIRADMNGPGWHY